MRKTRSALGLLVVSIVVLCAFTTAQAIDVGQYVISAKAGVVNLSSGRVMLQHKGKTEWQPVTSKDHLEAGDVVRTEADGRLETLLNPGSYLRLSENSEFQLTDPSLDSLRLRLMRGNAIVEATGFGGTSLLAEIDTPQTKIAIVQNGVYRIEVRPDATQLLVRKGRAMVGSDALVKVKRGKKIVVNGPSKIELAKFDTKSQDSFDAWSRDRAETLIAASRKLSNANLSYSIVSAMNRGWGFDPWDFRGGLGVWIYDARLACHTFYPFYSGMSSPYGYGYAGGLGLGQGYYRHFPPPSPGSGRAGVGGGQVTASGATLVTPPSGSVQPHPGADLPVRPGPVDRHVQREIQERAFRDLYQRGESGRFDRGAWTSSQPTASQSGSGPAPVSSPVSSPPPRVSGPSVGRESPSRPVMDH